QELIGINKSVSSRINMVLDGNKIETLTQFGKPEGQIYPEKELPENVRKLRGFVWRGDERIKSKDDIFPPEENELDEKIVRESKAEMAKENVPMEIRKETLEYDKNNPPPKPIVK
ncbi:MAG TPA: OstA-like protein, partial [Flavobacterium sp.]|nr:OstA-like protein [Flavobacterium sp.]